VEFEFATRWSDSAIALIHWSRLSQVRPTAASCIVARANCSSSTPYLTSRPWVSGLTSPARSVTARCLAKACLVTGSSRLRPLAVPSPPVGDRSRTCRRLPNHSLPCALLSASRAGRSFRERDVECRSATAGRRHEDSAAVGNNDRPRYRQSQTASASFPRSRGVGTVEAIEYTLDVDGWNTSTMIRDHHVSHLGRHDGVNFYRTSCWRVLAGIFDEAREHLR
jgi:hypothetical protein